MNKCRRIHDHYTPADDAVHNRTVMTTRLLLHKDNYSKTNVIEDKRIAVKSNKEKNIVTMFYGYSH